MAITRAQQYRQMLEDGGMLVSPSTTGRRPGYRNPPKEKQKGIYLHLKNVNDKINSNGFLGEQLEVTKGALITMFRDTLSEEKKEK